MADRLLLTGTHAPSAGGEGDCASIAGSNVDADSNMDSLCDAAEVLHIEHHEHAPGSTEGAGDVLSRFEAVFTTHPPILESLLSQLPTRSLFDLAFTSHYLRDFLSHYPLAWRTLSFRLPQPALLVTSPGVETPGGLFKPGRQGLLNGFLRHVVLPTASLLTSLDLCNTAVDGMMLCSNIWYPRRAMLKHLSVRGCKHVSIKYHILPFLLNFNPIYSPWAKEKLAIKSLYTYRCRHHRRRPYLPSSLARRDSDSEPTHELIELCHLMGVWTDTAWCPTPGGRCYRRKDYHGTRAAPGTEEVWVPFDRLWRSQNRIGAPNPDLKYDVNDGRLWECAEEGWAGEPLAGTGASSTGEGKEMAPHLRHSHRLFVDDIKCQQCGDPIAERCETCSVRMHCMGCRKTLCASCAFSRPLPRRRSRIRSFQALLNGTLPGSAQGPSTETSKDEFWWAPGATRSPNLINEMSDESDSDTDDGAGLAQVQQPPNEQATLNMHWCCLEPIFSGGGGIAFLGPGLAGRGAEKVRAAPLPNATRWKDRDFVGLLPASSEKLGKLKNHALYETIIGDDLDIVPFLNQDNIELQTQTCPRSLCRDCYRSLRWKVSCKGCKRALCKEHDFRGLKVRKCGYRDLNAEREWIRSRSPPRTLRIPAYRPPNPSPAGSPEPPTDGSVSIERGQSSSIVPPALSSDMPHTSSSSNASAVSTLDLSSATPLPTSKVSKSTQVPTAAPRRPRSQSFSGTRPLRPTSHFAASPIYPSVDRTPPLPGTPRHPVQWQGCGDYFCQTFRPVGDSRPRCSGGMKMCLDCGVWVCPKCLADSDPCPCKLCVAQFHCPYCAALPVNRAKCRREAEAIARLAKAARERMPREAEESARARGDTEADEVREFFEGLYGEQETAGWLDM